MIVGITVVTICEILGCMFIIVMFRLIGLKIDQLKSCLIVPSMSELAGSNDLAE